MPSALAITCEAPRVRAAIDAWLAETRLEPRSPIALEIRIAQPTAWSGDARPAFRQAGVVVRTGPGGGVHIWWEPAPAAAELAPGATTALVTLSPAAAARIDECLRTFLLTVVIFLLRRTGWHHIHAAVTVDPRDRGWLIAGNAHAGKSTTAALLASCGWQVGTDDVAFLAGDGGRVTAIAYRAPIALRPSAHRLLRRDGGVLLPKRRKVGYWPEDLGGRWVPRVEPAVILFTSVADDDDGARATRAEPMGQREALTELIRWSAWVILEPEFAQLHLELLAALARQARSYRVTLARDMFAHPERLAELVP